MSKKISDTLVMALKELCNHGELYPNYSGRGMRGETCFGISSNYGTPIKALGELLENLSTDGHDLDAIQELAEILQVAQTDNFGLGQIVYFPGYILPK